MGKGIFFASAPDPAGASPQVDAAIVKQNSDAKPSISRSVWHLEVPLKVIAHPHACNRVIFDAVLILIGYIE